MTGPADGDVAFVLSSDGLEVPIRSTATVAAMEQQQDQPKRERKAYRTPTLTHHGSLGELTQAECGSPDFPPCDPV